MQDRPTAAELLDAVRGFLELELLPALDDARLRFRVRVAMNALGIIKRELAREPALLRAEVERLGRLLGHDIAPGNTRPELRSQALALAGELAARIRRGDPPAGTLAVLKAIGADKLAVASPRYLERYR